MGNMNKFDRVKRLEAFKPKQHEAVLSILRERAGMPSGNAGECVFAILMKKYAAAQQQPAGIQAVGGENSFLPVAN